VSRENRSTRDLHALIAAQKMLHSALSGIGFDPAGRAKLGVAGVRRVTALEDLNSASAPKRVPIGPIDTDPSESAGRLVGGVQVRVLYSLPSEDGRFDLGAAPLE
jgi:hypothetical protein